MDDTRRRRRGDERGTILDQAEAGGHTLPESERDRARSHRRPPGASPAPIIPPD